MEPKKRWDSDGFPAHDDLADAPAAFARRGDGPLRVLRDLMGIDQVGFGPDTFFGDHVGLHVLYADNLDTGEVGEYEPVEYVEGMENPSEFPNVIRWLVGHGYSDEQIAKVVGGNALRALRDVWV